MTFIRQERHGQTALVSFARPPVNAFNLALVEEFSACLRELAADPPDGGLVITGDGGVFSCGVDFREVPLYCAEQHAEMVGHINGALTALYGLPTATVAAVSGHAIGGAFVTMLACDFRLAADVEGKLALTEVTAGIPYPACPMEIVKAEMEPGLRRNLVLSGDAIGPAAARDHRIIDELVEPGVLIERALELARARAGASAYAVVKAQLRRDALSRMREIIKSSSDPMLGRWL